jgi:hypothetical protein
MQSLGQPGALALSWKILWELETSVFLPAAGSRDVEFPLVGLESISTGHVESNGDIRFTLTSGQDCVFLNSGLPINFSVRSLPPYISDLLFLLVSAGFLQQSKGDCPVGLHKLSKELESLAARYWLQFHPAMRR